MQYITLSERWLSNCLVSGGNVISDENGIKNNSSSYGTIVVRLSKC